MTYSWSHKSSFSPNSDFSAIENYKIKIMNHTEGNLLQCGIYCNFINLASIFILVQSRVLFQCNPKVNSTEWSLQENTLPLWYVSNHVNEAIFEMHIRTHTGEKSYKCRQCANCERPFQLTVVLQGIWEHTLERTHINAITVKRPFNQQLSYPVFKNTVRRNHISVANVARPF